MATGGLVKYDERLIAFVDVLGFSQLTLESVHDERALKTLSALVAADKIFEKFYDEVLEFGAATFFSDSLVVSMKLEQAWYLFRHTGLLCRYLLLQGLPCRGAIALGPLYHVDNVIVGPALVEAYYLESKEATTPRIILNQGALALWKKEFREGCAYPQLEGLVKQDGEHAYLDIFHPRWMDSFVAWPDGVPADHSTFMSLATTVIEAGRRNAPNEYVRRKYDWLAAECAAHAAAG